MIGKNMYISLKAATTSDAGVMSAQDKTSLDNLSNKLVVLEQLDSKNIILKSIGGKVKDSEMRAIVDASGTGSNERSIPGMITIPGTGTYHCICSVNYETVQGQDTMLGMNIGIIINESENFS